MAKILILGGTGAIGKYLVSELSATDHSVFVTSRRERADYKNIQHIRGNAKDYDFLKELCQQSFDCIVDFMHWGTEEFKTVYPVLLDNTGHYVFLSSYRVYADADMSPLSEDSPLLLDVARNERYLKSDVYELAKARCERLLHNSAHSNYTILRPGITFSTFRFQICSLEANLILPRSLQGKPLLLPYEVMGKRAAIGWAGMAGKMIAPLLLQERARQEVFNIGSMESHTWKTIAGYYHDLLGADYVLVDLNTYLSFGFHENQVKYDRMYNRIISNRKIINFLHDLAISIDIPPLLASLKHEIDLYKRSGVAIAENNAVGYKMDKFIVDHVDRLRLVFGDQYRLRVITQNILKPAIETAEFNTLVDSARAHVAKGEFQQAIWEANELRLRSPLRNEGYLIACDAYCKTHDYVEADNILKQGLELIPDDYRLWFAAYDVAMALKDYPLALVRAQETIRKFPKYISGFIFAARVSMALGQLDEAEYYCDGGFKIDPRKLELWLMYAEIPMRKGEWKRALEVWTRFRELFPRRHEGYTRAAVACFRLGQLDISVQYCREYLNNNPPHIEPLIVCFDVAMRRRDFNQALDVSFEMQRCFPELYSGYFRAASTFKELGNYAKAEEAGLRGITLSPGAIMAWLAYADIPMREGNYVLARERYAEIRARFPNELAGYTCAAQACKKLGDFEQAREICKQGMAIGENARRILSYTLADILAQAPENYFDSIDILKELFESDESVRDSFQFYQQLYHCGLLLANKFNSDEGNKYFKLILKLFLSDPNGQYSSHWFHTFIYYCKKPRKEQIKVIEQIIEEGKLFTNFAVLLYSRSTLTQKFEAFCEVLRLKDHICVLHILAITQYYDDYKRILEDITHNEELLASFSDMGIYIYLNLLELFDLVNRSCHTKLLLALKDKNSEIHNFLRYRDINAEMLRASAPSLQPSKRLRVAVCIRGQLRGYHEAFGNWYKILKLDDHDVSYFVHTWKNIGRKLPWSHMFYPRTFSGAFLRAYQDLDPPLEEIRKYYKTFYSLLQGCADIDYNALETFYHTKNIVIEDENDAKFANFTNQQKMHYKIYACNEFLHQPMQDFDLVISIRPDFHMTPYGDINLRQIYEDSVMNDIIYTDDKHVAFWTYEMVIGDCLAIGTQPLMDIYARTYLDHYKFANIQHFGHRGQLIQHLSISYQLLAHGIGMKSIPVRIGALDPAPISTRDIYESLQKDISIHPQITYWDQVLLNACKEDLEAQSN